MTNETKQSNKLMSIAETAAYMGISESKLRKLIANREIKTRALIYVGRTLMFNKTKLDEYLDNNCF